jgi:hypothetical protein
MTGLAHSWTNKHFAHFLSIVALKTSSHKIYGDGIPQGVLRMYNREVVKNFTHGSSILKNFLTVYLSFSRDYF